MNSIDEFQNEVARLLIRNINILDILTKCTGSCSKLCRSAVKAATGCGCVKLRGEKTKHGDMKNDLERIKKGSGVCGELCAECRGGIEGEIGELLFYLSSLCNCLGLSLDDIMRREMRNVKTLGKYSLH